MSKQDKAQALQDAILAVEAEIEALPEGTVKTGLQRRAIALHEVASRLHDFAVGRGEIQPLSGGDPNKGP